MASERNPRKTPRHLILVFVLLSVSIWVGGYLYHSVQKREIKQHERESLSAIADLKAEQIANWRRERLENSAIVSDNPYRVSRVREWLMNPGASDVKAEILSWMAARQKYHPYSYVLLLDGNGVVRLSVPGGKTQIDSYPKALFAQAMRTRKVVFSEMYRSESDNGVYLDLLVPLCRPEGHASLCVGALLLRMDPRRFLYPLIQSWPTPSRTSETLLIRYEGDTVVFLNELRHDKHGVLPLRLPRDRLGLPTVAAAGRRKGVFEGLDYRGVPVLAAIRAIPDSPWFVVAKVDEDEMYADVRGHFCITMVIVSVLILAGAAGVGLIWRDQQAQFYRSQYEGEVERRVLAERYEYLTRYANDIILLADDAWKITDANERATASYGYPYDSLLRLSLRDLQSPDQQAALDELMKQVEERHGSIFETMHRREDGSTFPVEISARSIAVEGKRVYQCIIRDVTERKQAEEALRVRDWAIESSTSGICLADLEGNVTYANESCLRMWGYRDDQQVLGRPVVPFQQMKDEAAEVERQLREKGNWTGELRAKKTDGSSFDVQVSASTVKDAAGKPICMMASFVDITERKRAEDDKRRLEARLYQTQKMEALGSLAGGIAHDFNNILTAITGAAEMALCQGDDWNRVRRGIGRVLDAASRAKDLVKQILAFSRQSQPATSPVKLDLIVKEALELLRASTPSTIDIQWRVAADCGAVLADPTQVHQVVMNLCINAVHAIGAEVGVLDVDVADADVGPEEAGRCAAEMLPGPYVRLTVKDTGHGIDQSVLGQMFDPFFTTKAPGEGTGMGLAVVQSIVKSHGGFITVESDLGRGATFHVFFPRIEETAAQQMQAPVPIPVGNERILFVDDEEAVIQIGQEVLETLGYKVVPAQGSVEALAMFRTQADAFDLVITDQTMPQMTGIRLARELRGVRPDIPIILCTGFGRMDTLDEAKRVGIRKILMKPISRREFAEAIRQTLDEHT